MDFGSIHIPTALAAVLVVIGLFVVAKFLLKAL